MFFERNNTVFNYARIEEGLEVVVAVMADVGGVEDGSDIGEGLGTVVAGLVVDDTDSFCAVRQCYFVDPVNNSTDIVDGQVASFQKRPGSGAGGLNFVIIR